MQKKLSQDAGSRGHVEPEAAAARELRRRPGSAPVTAGEVSFTTARQHAIRSMVQSRVTAGTSLAALAALAEDTSRATLHTLITTDRERHSPREQKHRLRFPHTQETKTTVTGTPQITLFQPRTG